MLLFNFYLIFYLIFFAGLKKNSLNAGSIVLVT